MINYGGVGGFWDEHNEGIIYLFRHKALAEEGSDCIDHIIINSRPHLLIENDRKTVRVGAFKVLHLEKSGSYLFWGRDG